VTIDLRRFLSEEQQRQFEAELEQCRTRKQDDLEREEREAERLQAKYEQEK
jgi:Skp family chaperone for outer membrane proteins